MRVGCGDKAFTLIEAMVAMAILAAAAAGILLPYAAGAAVQVDGARRTLAAHLAADLLDEIAATEFSSIVATWNGYSEAEGQIKDAAGVVLGDPVYSRFSRQASCQTLGMGSRLMVWATVDVYYEGQLMVHLGTMIGD